MSKEYTIIGVFDDTGEVVNYACVADDAYDAMRKLAELHEGNDNLQILGTIEGRHVITAPGSEGSRAAYANDVLAWGMEA